MARRKESGFEMVASMPWPFGLVAGLLGYGLVQYALGPLLGHSGNPYIAALGKVVSAGSAAPLAWLWLAGCWCAALSSLLGRRRRRRLFDQQSGRQSIGQLDWQEFELLTGEAFRRQGYTVSETGLGGADGGIDLKLRREGRLILVQCKQWRSQRVGVKEVREMYGTLVHEGADAVKIVALGEYTADARRFVQGKPIELIHADALLASVRQQQVRRDEPESLWHSPAAFVGCTLLGFALLGVLGNHRAAESRQEVSSTRSAPTATTLPVLAVPTARPLPPPSSATRPVATTRQSASTVAPPAPHFEQTPMDDAALREWKRRNAAAMKILEKTTAEVP